MTNVTGATCTVSPARQPACPSTVARAQLAAHLRLSQATQLTLLQQTLTVQFTSEQSFSTGYGALYPSVEGAELNVGT